MDCKAKKIISMHQALHTRANVDRLHVPIKEVSKGPLSIWEYVNIKSKALGQYPKNSEDE